MKRKYIIGISCFFHDSAIAIVENGKPIFCLQEERVSRIKGDKRFPELALRYASDRLNIIPSEIDKLSLKYKVIIEGGRPLLLLD